MFKCTECGIIKPQSNGTITLNKEFVCNSCFRLRKSRKEIKANEEYLKSMLEPFVPKEFKEENNKGVDKKI